MYDKEYAEKWILNDLLGKDTFRLEHLEPFIRREIQGLPRGAKILDVGCGWGMPIKFLREDQSYIGVDPTKEFFPHIQKKYPNKSLKLLEGRLPSQIPVGEEFDLVICSMVLHCLRDIKESLKTLFSKTKQGGRVLVIDFGDSSEKVLREETYDPIHEENASHIRGLQHCPQELE